MAPVTVVKGTDSEWPLITLSLVIFMNFVKKYVSLKTCNVADSIAIQILCF